MGRLFVEELEGRVNGCKECHTDLALSTDFINRRGDYGIQELFSKLFNVFLAPSTVPNVISDVFCVFCCALIGYYYIDVRLGPCFRVSGRKLRGPEGSDDEVGSDDEGGSDEV